MKSFEIPIGDPIFQPGIGERTRSGTLESQSAKKGSSGRSSGKSSGKGIGKSSGGSPRQVALHNKLSILDLKQEQTPAAPTAGKCFF